MKRYYAYTRVSTVRQGEHGVSLQEQKDAIERFAARHSLQIDRWFTEKETAAKTGRPVFNQMLREIKLGAAQGIIIHKIDRSARNLKDWAEIGQLAESGIEVHFANEAVDLSSPTGMLSADVQAVVAAHYIRNLREEVKKGYYGRLKQGLCPYPAPLGYTNHGTGKPKTIDPRIGPLVHKGFQLYATGRYSQQSLAEELNSLGLRTRAGKPLTKNAIGSILTNRFYIGEMFVRKSGETFAGIHEPLVSRECFDTVQSILSGKFVVKSRTHRFIFSRLITCGYCGRSLIAEIQKGHVYYRCHGKHLAILKEEAIDDHFASIFERLRLLPEEEEILNLTLANKKTDWQSEAEKLLRAETLRLHSVQDRIARLTDAYVDGLLEKQVFEQKKTALQLECREVEGQIRKMQSGDRSYLVRYENIVELIKRASPLYESEGFEEKREVIVKVMSNRIVREKELDITVRFPFSDIIARQKGVFGGAQRDASRTFWTKLLTQAVRLAQTGGAYTTM